MRVVFREGKSDWSRRNLSSLSSELRIKLYKIQIHNVRIRGVLRTERFVETKRSCVVPVYGPREARYAFGARDLLYCIHKHPADPVASGSLLHIEVNDIEVTDIVTIISSGKEDIPNQSGCIFRHETAKGGVGAKTVSEVLLRTEAVVALVANTAQIRYKLPKKCLDCSGI